jgi:hypothetical protein
LTNWGEGASAFADALGKLLGPMFEAMNKAPQAADNKTEGDDRQPSNPPAARGDGQKSAAPTPFSNGEMVFLSDRVIFCGVDICSGPRSETRRQLLELLGKRHRDGTFVAYGSDRIAKKINLRSGARSVAGQVRDLRNDIVLSLRDQASIKCGRLDVVLSGGPGYRLAPSVIVRNHTQTVLAESSAAAVPDDPYNDDPDVPDRADPGVPDVPEDDPDGSNETAAGRRNWILKQLAEGRELRAPDVVRRFDYSNKTAKRALQALRKEGRIIFKGDAQTGSYRLKRPPKSQG